MNLNAVQIMRRTGCRYPLCFLDQIVDIKQGISLVGKKNVNINEPYFQGHFPGNPVMPGVLIVEAMTQAAKILFDSDGSTLRLSKIKKARFRKMVKPGDQLIIKVNKKDAMSKTCEAKAFVKDELACSAELIFS